MKWSISSTACCLVSLTPKEDKSEKYFELQCMDMKNKDILFVVYLKPQFLF